jgi:hypothetical protein
MIVEIVNLLDNTSGDAIDFLACFRISEFT